MIGANGAGKTSTLRAVSGLNPVKSGSISYDGKIISNIAPHKIVAAGISQVQKEGVFLEIRLVKKTYF